jgi:hypothetical protein
MSDALRSRCALIKRHTPEFPFCPHTLCLSLALPLPPDLPPGIDYSLCHRLDSRSPFSLLPGWQTGD